MEKTEAQDALYQACKRYIWYFDDIDFRHKLDEDAQIATDGNITALEVIIGNIREISTSI